MIGDLSVIRELSSLTDSLIVGVSGGKDSLAVLDLCRMYMPRARLEGYFLYAFPNLSFQESFLGYVERRFEISIRRLPHWSLSAWLNTACYRPHTDATLACPKIKISHVWEFMRRETRIEWVVTGEKIVDNLSRRGHMKIYGTCNQKYRHAFPLANWSTKQVYGHLKQRGILLPHDYQFGFGTNIGDDLDGKELKVIRDSYPEDWQRIKDVFPFIDACILRHEISSVRDGAVEKVRNQSREVQPTPD